MIRQLACTLLLFVAFNAHSQTNETFHDFWGETILGDSLHFSSFHGKKVMVVNTATYCVFTYQYEELQQLYDLYKDSNFTIVGFPCNDFGDQEPDSDSTIADFCEDIYNIQFQMMSKVSVIGTDTAEVYKWLEREDRNGVADAAIVWNFHKFLIDEAGNWVAHYPSTTSPLAKVIRDWIVTPSVLTGIEEPLPINITSSNITAHNLRIAFNNLTDQKTFINLYSVTGQLISNIFEGNLSDGEIIDINTSSLANNIYLLQVHNKNQSSTFRFAVVK